MFFPFQDISAEGADRLYSLCKIMVDEGPQVFTPLLEEDKNKKYQEEVPVFVQKWMTFKELMIILRANLQEIVDRYVFSFPAGSPDLCQGTGVQRRGRNCQKGSGSAPGCGWVFTAHLKFAHVFLS